MAGSTWQVRESLPAVDRSDVTGAIGDSVTVLPIVVAVAALTDRSAATMLLWFGAFQVVWGLHYGVPLSVEPMKALAGLLLAGAITTGEFLVAGLLAGAVLLAVGLTGSLGRLERYLGDPVARGVQLAVALLLIETGLELAAGDLSLAAVAVVVAAVAMVLGGRGVSALTVLAAGGFVAVLQGGTPAPAVPNVDPLAHLSPAAATTDALAATAAQLATTVGNAAVATSVLVADFYDREVSPDDLSVSMGAMNLLAVPVGGIPMCHGSGGLAGKYAFGARTPAANLVLGAGYVVVALGAVGLVMAFPLSMLGVVLAVVAAELAHASFRTTDRWLVVVIGLLGVLTSIGVAFVVGVCLYLLVGSGD